MPDHLHTWLVVRKSERREVTLLCEVIDDGLWGLDERVVHDDAVLVVDDAHTGEFLAVFGQTLSRGE